MGDVQTWIWKPRERVLVKDLSKWNDYVSMFVFCIKMGNHYFRKHIPSDSERQKEAKIVLHMLKRFKTLASLNYFDSNIKNRT
jgi:hypothetical protein